jgi:long-chain acyl-CoA synthetase
VVPTIIAQLVDWEDSRSANRAETFQHIRFLRTSSAPISPSLHREFMDKFPLLLIQGMGSSEGGNVFSNPLPPQENKIGSVGLPWGFETRIINRDGIEVPQGEPGEVLLRGAALAQVYYKEPGATAAAFDRQGWLHTGDLAYRDSDGFFFVVGRSKELIIKGGVNIAPRQIDEVLESHPAVREAAVVGVPDHHLGEDIVAFVVVRMGMQIDENELPSFCERHLGQYKTPTRIHFSGAFPKGPSGKVQRLRLLDELARLDSSQGSRIEMSDLPSSIERTIGDAWMQVLHVPRMEVDDNFFS